MIFPIRRNSRPEMVLRRNNIIENLHTKLINVEINPVQYLKSIYYQSKTNLGDIVPSDDEIDSFLDAEEIEEQMEW